MQATAILLIAVGYVGLLFAIAYRYDREGAWPAGRPVAGAAIYAMSIGVYCTSWTFYGSVGRASVSGVDFLPVYLGPTLTFCLGWPLLAKMLRVSKTYRITSIADFIASRYGKSGALAGSGDGDRRDRLGPLYRVAAQGADESFVMLASGRSGRNDGMTPSSPRCCWPRLRSCSARGISTERTPSRACHRHRVRVRGQAALLRHDRAVRRPRAVSGLHGAIRRSEARPELAHLFRFGQAAWTGRR